MQYFVSIENTTYFLWQIELLIESFKRHNLEDKLVIAIAENNNPVSGEYQTNLMNHKNKFLHFNHEVKFKNKFLGLWAALEKKMLTYPFAIIHPDMVLYKPIKDDSITSDVTFSIEQETEFIQNNFIKNYINEIKEITHMEEDLPSIPLGGVLVFNKEIEYLCKRLFFNADKLLELEQPQDTSFKLEKSVWILTLIEAALKLFGNSKNIKLGTGAFEQTLMHHDVHNNFIHYKHGLPPDWSKYQFLFGQYAFMWNGAGPYDSLLKVNGTSSTNYVCELIESYKKLLKHDS